MKRLILNFLRSIGYVVVHEPVLRQMQERSSAGENQAAHIANLEHQNAQLSAAINAIESEKADNLEYTGKNLDVSERQFQGLLPLLAEHRNELLKIHFVRDFLASKRYAQLTKSRPFEFAPYNDGNVLENTVKYNKGALEHFLSLDRIRMLLGVVTSIWEIARNAHDRKILLVGPRSETELYSAMAAGFQLQNVSALDLFSYSPLVTAGDMHEMPFADSSMDIVFITCVLSYSRNTSKVAAETVRVLKNGGFVAFIEPIHYDFVPSENKADLPVAYSGAIDLGKDSPHWGSVDDVLRIFGDAVDTVPFRCEASAPYDGMGLNISTVFKIKK
ncbi:class I SAM-dependent methyltransferase [Tardiphaga sp. vice278]|uniref:class I SAM-dependent methyltransferase n=1 Tax=Tardiphaga sp. vice278 TaxID=2592815 RepID=UPI001165AAF3|nr:methyltransferase domain-containing protein [Tardiphaga sp. vice278]QDM17959.1 class I SAM-dependent methyltransferase [Tardiphaga sp. vice278]